MRPIGVIADIHVGNHAAFGGSMVGRRNERCLAIGSAIRQSVDLLESLGASTLVIAGDLFDNDRPLPDHVQMVGQALRGPLKKKIKPGNHDCHSAEPGDHAMSPLSLMDGVVVVDAPQCITTDDGVGIEYLPFWVDVLQYTPTGRIVIAHHGLADASTPPFLRHGKGALQVSDIFAWMNLHGVDYYVAGDWHVHKHWEKGGKHIIQVGALVPTGWNNPGHYGYGSVIVIDDNGWRREQVPGPRFIYSASREDVIKDVRRAKKRGDVPYVKASCPAFEDPELEGAHMEWAPVIEKAAAAVQVAAAHLQSASTLDECMHLYVTNDSTIPDEMKDDVLGLLGELMTA